VSALPGIEDVVVDGVSAAITPSGDVAAAARATSRLLADAGARAALADGARAIDVRRWAPEAMNAAIEQAYTYCRA
jgi:glycosyltransferase involved in cell wall biosynthesis